MEDKDKYYELAHSFMISVAEMQDKANEEANHARQIEDVLSETVEGFDSAISVFLQDEDIDKLLGYFEYDINSTLELDSRIKKDDKYRDFLVRCKNKVERWIRERKESCNSKDEKEFICEEITKLTDKLCNEIRDSFAWMASSNKQGNETEYDMAYAQYIGAKEILDYVELNFSIKDGKRLINLFNRIENDLDVGCIQYDDAWEERMKDEYVKMFNRYNEYVKDIKRRFIEKFPDSADIK